LYSCYVDFRHPTSFPTRRSSDLNAQQVGLLFSVILMPMIFFGCAYYPWRGLDRVPALKYAVLINPLVYVAEGMRATLTPSMPHIDRKSTRLNSSHSQISYAVFCL